jgi:hypothetical protein
MPLLEAHRAFCERAVRQLVEDARVVALLACGSTGRQEEDEWSDLDLLVVSSEDPVSVVASAADAARFGDLVVWVDCSFNAPAGGAQAFARYITPEGLLLVDWNSWPLAAARVATGTRVLWSRPGVTLDAFPGSFHDLVASQPRRQIPPYNKEQRAAWELCMCHLAVSLPARGRDARPALETIGVAADPGPEPLQQLAALAEHVRSLGRWVPSRVIKASLHRIDAATARILDNG